MESDILDRITYAKERESLMVAKETVKQSLKEAYKLKPKELSSLFDSQETLTDIIRVHSKYVLDHSKPSFDPALIDQLTQVWLSIQIDLFKGHPNYLKNQSQAGKEALAYLAKSTQFSTDFKQSKLFSFFSDQVCLLHSIAMYLNVDISSQLSELTAKKDTLTNQLSKLQKDCRDMNTKEKDALREAQKAKQQLEQALADSQSFKNQLSEVVEERVQVKMRLEGQKEQMDRQGIEVQSLKQKVMDQDTEANLLRQQLRELQKVQLELESASEEGAKLKKDLEWSQTQVQRKGQECDELKKIIGNLQRAMQQQQEEQDQVQRANERQTTEDRTLIQNLQLQNQTMKDKVRELAGLEDSLATLNLEMHNLKDQLRHTQTERDQIKQKAQDLLEKVNQDREALEYMVDRRMINKFLVNFVNPESTPQVKGQMLDTMSRILGFSMEEKQMLGIVKKATIDENGDKKGIKDSLISFFMQDDDE
ncbi:hypothetical protein FGO68_gene4570 [Halteria grandinella]|uniref:GRIP domain-containing protein n=1 Tax=Halteria grandinella TaxID=5974 RepID=A0A8J8NGT5_HALGN|nr:hypothetical protein FGO68_gene4570 [Halteria grandinella]